MNWFFWPSIQGVFFYKYGNATMVIDSWILRNYNHVEMLDDFNRGIPAFFDPCFFKEDGLISSMDALRMNVWKGNCKTNILANSGAILKISGSIVLYQENYSETLYKLPFTSIVWFLISLQVWWPFCPCAWIYRNILLRFLLVSILLIFKHICIFDQFYFIYLVDILNIS